MPAGRFVLIRCGASSNSGAISGTRTPVSYTHLFDSQKIYIDYVFEQEIREDAMQLSYEKAKEVAASVEGKSDEDKALAINQWVIDNTEYRCV